MWERYDINNSTYIVSTVGNALNIIVDIGGFVLFLKRSLLCSPQFQINKLKSKRCISK